MFYCVLQGVPDSKYSKNRLPIFFKNIKKKEIPICFTVFYRGYPIQNIQKIGYLYVLLYNLDKVRYEDINFTSDSHLNSSVNISVDFFFWNRAFPYQTTINILPIFSIFPKGLELVTQRSFLVKVFNMIISMLRFPMFYMNFPIPKKKVTMICFTVFYRGYPIQNIQKIGFRYFLFKLKKKEIPICFTVFYRGYPIHYTL